MKYLAAEMLELAAKAARDNKKIRIILLHLELPIRNEEEYSKLLSGVFITKRVMSEFSLLFVVALCGWYKDGSMDKN